MMSLKNNSAKILIAGMKQIYSGKKNILHLIQISLVAWVDYLLHNKLHTGSFII